MAAPTQSATKTARKTKKPLPAEELPDAPESSSPAKRKGALLEGTPKKRQSRALPKNGTSATPALPHEDTIPELSYKSMYEASKRMNDTVRAEYSKSKQELAIVYEQAVLKGARVIELEAENEDLRLKVQKVEEDGETGVDILEATIRNRDAQIESLFAEMRRMQRGL